MIQHIIAYIDIFLWIALAIPTAYLFVFSIASLKKSPETKAVKSDKNRFAVIFPVYASDEVIKDSVKRFFLQDYDRALFDVIVISDHLSKDTDEALISYGARVINAAYENSSKAKALILASQSLDRNAYDAVVILDVDNTVDNNFLTSVNNRLNCGFSAIQTHRTAKNNNTEIAVLDGISEEINNSIFRRGHINIGISSALIGSGMIFNYAWFADNIQRADSAGEDKELELMLLRQNIYIDYAEDIYVYDEKTSDTTNFYNQRRRWIAAQFYLLSGALSSLPSAFTTANWSYIDKVCQWMLPPRLIMLGGIFIMTILSSVYSLQLSYKWILLSLMQITLFSIAIPACKRSIVLSKAITKVPSLFILTVKNIFRLKGAGKKFIRTEHISNEDKG